MKILLFLSPLLFLVACFKGEAVDLVVRNAKIHTMDLSNKVHEAMAIKDGKVIETGPERQILNKYSAKETIDAGGRDIYPGFTDAHGHLLSLMQQRLNLDLVGCRSFEEVLERIKKYTKGKKRSFIVGRGWDQSLWEKKDFPTNAELNRLYPDLPVLLFRVDGHAALANACLLDRAKINTTTAVLGGKIEVVEGKLTGLLLDNAINQAASLIPPYSLADKQLALLDIQHELFQYGITGVHEAGIEFEDIHLFKSLYDEKNFKLFVNAMLMPSPENQKFAQEKGIYKHKNLLIRSFKVVGDGSLGSRGACLKHVYSDAPHTHGFLTTSIEQLHEVAQVARKTGYQMNTHAIGDSTNKLIIDVIAQTYAEKKDHRWRIEHAQVLEYADIKLLGRYGVLPSVQPTHAVSDQRWALDRLGENRMRGAYAYKSILDQCGLMVLGTDFPVESFNPFLTIHAAVQRKDAKNFPKDGFLPLEKITLDQCMQGMTIWPAFACFEEKNRGSLENNKEATFVVLEFPLTSNTHFQENFAHATYIKGKKVYSAE